MAHLLRMPEVAAGGTKAVLTSWSVSEDVAFSAEDTLAEIETDKANVDLDAESDGVLLKTLVAAGTEVAAGDPIALLGTRAELGGDITAMLTELGVHGAAAAPKSSSPAAAEPAVTAATTAGVADPAAPEGPATPDGSAEPPTPDGSAVGERGRIFASPLARQLARTAGLTLGELAPGSGPGGRVRRSDVQAAITLRQTAPTPTTPVQAAAFPAEVAPSTVPAKTAATGYVDVPHSNLRRLIAARLAESKQRVPHFYLNGSAHVDKLLALRRELNLDSPVKISLNDLIIKAAAKAHSATPEMNVIWTPDAMRQFDHVDISVAIASDRGLVTPTLRSVETLAIGAISQQVKDFAQRADGGKLKQNELEGGALTVTNLGMFGMEDFGAIINPPQSAILAVGAAREHPIAVDGRLKIGTMMRVTLSVDHRAIDGRLAAQWLRTFLSVLESPMRILT